MQKNNTEPYFLEFTLFAGRAHSKWTTLADFWTPAEAVCMASRHRPLLMDVVGLDPLSGMRFLLVSREASTKKEAAPKSRHRNALQNTFLVRVHSILDAGPYCWDSCRGHACDPTPLAGVGGYSRRKVSLWHTFLTGHTFSCHKTALHGQNQP